MKACSLCVVLAIGLLAGCAYEEPKPYPYSHPLSSPGTKFGGLPPAIQKTIRAQAGTAEIYDIIKTNYSGHGVYEVYFRDWVRYPPLYIAPDGSVLYPDMHVAIGAPRDTFGAVSGAGAGGLKLGDLPINVGNTIFEKAPTAEVAHINKMTYGNQIVYVITFKNEGLYPKMYVAEDGTLMNWEGF